MGGTERRDSTTISKTNASHETIFDDKSWNPESHTARVSTSLDEPTLRTQKINQKADKNMSI